jgi:hypothetical protein
LVAGLALGWVVACGADATPREFPALPGSTGSGTQTLAGTTQTGSATGSSGGIVVTPPEAGFGGSTGHPEGGGIIGTLPPDFVKTEAGGYKLGQAITGAGVSDTGLGRTAFATKSSGSCAISKGDVGGHPISSASAEKGPRASSRRRSGPTKPGYTALAIEHRPAATCPYGQATTGKAN